MRTSRGSDFGQPSIELTWSIGEALFLIVNCCKLLHSLNSLLRDLTWSDHDNKDMCLGLCSSQRGRCRARFKKHIISLRKKAETQSPFFVCVFFFVDPFEASQNRSSLSRPPKANGWPITPKQPLKDHSTDVFGQLWGSWVFLFCRSFQPSFFSNTQLFPQGFGWFCRKEHAWVKNGKGRSSDASDEVTFACLWA